MDHDPDTTPNLAPTTGYFYFFIYLFLRSAAVSTRFPRRKRYLLFLAAPGIPPRVIPHPRVPEPTAKPGPGATAMLGGPPGGRLDPVAAG